LNIFYFTVCNYATVALHQGHICAHQLCQLCGSTLHSDFRSWSTLVALQTAQDGETHSCQSDPTYNLSHCMPLPGDFVNLSVTHGSGRWHRHYTFRHSHLLSNDTQSGSMDGKYITGNQHVVLQVLHMYAKSGEI